MSTRRGNRLSHNVLPADVAAHFHVGGGSFAGARQRLANNVSCDKGYSDQSPSRAPRAATRGAACVSTWLGE